jgi:D-glycero-alpha-D-manno-heptose-7-phosphate kinase
MIISQTPFRVSFSGGGTDLPAFYENDYGAVLSTAIEQYMYVNVHKRFNDTYRIAYSRIEIANDASKIEHELVKAAIEITNAKDHLEITTIGDVPAGTGMGSSSTLTVGLLNALYAYKGHLVNKEELSRKACEVEIDILKKPIGRQDQYAAAYGGLNYIRFNSDHSVNMEPVPCTIQTIRELEKRILLFYTGQERSADQILKMQSEGTSDKRNILIEMRDLADEMRKSITGKVNLDEFAKLLHHGWELKSSLGFGITNDFINDWYKAALKMGAQGGKLLGAGGGGFLLVMAPPERHAAIREILGFPRELTFSIDRTGSRIVLIN